LLAHEKCHYRAFDEPPGIAGVTHNQTWHGHGRIVPEQHGGSVSRLPEIEALLARARGHTRSEAPALPRQPERSAVEAEPMVDLPGSSWADPRRTRGSID